MSTSGPLFTKRLDASVEAAVRRAETKLADAGVALVRNVVRSSAQRRTGRYERAVRNTRTAGSSQVNDGGIVYGPWLEGVSRRNATTSFKGYAPYRKAAQQLEKRARPITEAELRKALGGI